MIAHSSQPNGLILEIQSAAIDPKVNVAALLRKAKVAAVKLGQTDFTSWLDQEIDGYSCTYDELPDYRKTNGSLKVQNPYHGLVPFIIRDEKVEDLVTRTPTFQGVSTLQALIEKTTKQDTLSYQLPPGHRNILMDMMEVPLEPVLIVSASQIEIVLSRVTSMILNWSLELEQAGILGEGMSFTMNEKAKAAPITQNFYNSNIGTAGSVSGEAHVQNNQSTIVAPINNQILSEFILESRKVSQLLPDEVRPQIEEELSSLEGDVSEESKRRHLLSIKNILEGASGGVAAQGILALLGALLG